MKKVYPVLIIFSLLTLTLFFNTTWRLKLINLPKEVRYYFSDEKKEKDSYFKNVLVYYYICMSNVQYVADHQNRHSIDNGISYLIGFKEQILDKVKLPQSSDLKALHISLNEYIDVYIQVKNSINSLQNYQMVLGDGSVIDLDRNGINAQNDLKNLEDIKRKLDNKRDLFAMMYKIAYGDVELSEYKKKYKITY
jgi:hypothetical protein